MLDLRKLIFRGDAPPADLAPTVRQALESWKDSPLPDLDEPHFHARYVVIDALAAPEGNTYTGLAAVAVARGGIVLASDVLAINLAGGGDGGLLDQEWMALLAFLGKGAVVSYVAEPLQAFLQEAFRQRLGVDFKPPWVELSRLLPECFTERLPSGAAREDWLETFGIEAAGGRDAVTQVLGLARLLQLALPRAVERGIETPRRLVAAGQGRRLFRLGS